MYFLNFFIDQIHIYYYFYLIFIFSTVKFKLLIYFPLFKYTYLFKSIL